MKKVFESNKATIRAWISKNTVNFARYGCNPKRSIFFEEEIIYSYGKHFPMAAVRWLNNEHTMPDGSSFNKIVLLTKQEFSQTTSAHKWQVQCVATDSKALILPAENIPALYRRIVYRDGMIEITPTNTGAIVHAARDHLDEVCMNAVRLAERASQNSRWAFTPNTRAEPRTPYVIQRIEEARQTLIFVRDILEVHRDVAKLADELINVTGNGYEEYILEKYARGCAARDLKGTTMNVT